MKNSREFATRIEYFFYMRLGGLFKPERKNARPRMFFCEQLRVQVDSGKLILRDETFAD